MRRSFIKIKIYAVRSEEDAFLWEPLTAASKTKTWCWRWPLRTCPHNHKTLPKEILTLRISLSLSLSWYAYSLPYTTKPLRHRRNKLPSVHSILHCLILYFSSFINLFRILPSRKIILLEYITLLSHVPLFRN